MDDGSKLRVAHLHLGSAELCTLVLLTASLGSADFMGTPSVVLWPSRGVVSWWHIRRRLLPLLPWVTSYHLSLGVLWWSMLPNSLPNSLATIPMCYRHIHSRLNILLRLLRKLRLVSDMLRILKSPGHANNLCLRLPIIIIFSTIIIPSRMTNRLQLRTGVHCIYFDWTCCRLRGLLHWAILRGSGFFSL